MITFIRILSQKRILCISVILNCGSYHPFQWRITEAKKTESAKCSNFSWQLIPLYQTTAQPWTWIPGSIGVYMNECSTGSKSTVRSQAKSDNAIKNRSYLGLAIVANPQGYQLFVEAQVTKMFHLRRLRHLTSHKSAAEPVQDFVHGITWTGTIKLTYILVMFHIGYRLVL